MDESADLPDSDRVMYLNVTAFIMSAWAYGNYWAYKNVVWTPMGPAIVYMEPGWN